MRKILTTLLMMFIGLQSWLVYAKAPTEALGINLQGYDYPYPVKYFPVTVENKPLQMAYMDVAPVGKANGQTVVLLHGNRFWAAYWQATIKFLTEHGFRVIVPDQLGYGKSSKEDIYYTFQLLAKNTHALLNHLQIKKVNVVGHSLGGMLATRFALMYPESVRKLVLEDPIGLEDYRLAIPYKSVDEMYKASLKFTWDNILEQNKELYADWQSEYLPYAEATYRITLNSDYPKVALVNALLYQMLYTQPVLYEFSHVKMPTLIIYGDKDHVAPGKNFAPKDVQEKLGNYPVLAKNAARKIPDVQLYAFKNIGHVPHLEATEEFNQVLVDFLK